MVFDKDECNLPNMYSPAHAGTDPGHQGRSLDTN